MDTEELALSTLYDEILNFKLLHIPSDTRFWMVRTKKGYFYHEFISNYLIFIALATIIGGGKFLTVELPGIARIIKDFQTIKDEKRKNDAEITQLELDNLQKAIDIEQRIKETGVDPQILLNNIGILSACRQSMQINPIESLATPITNVTDEIVETDDEEQEA